MIHFVPHAPPFVAFILATLSAGFMKVAQTVPAIPQWMENGAVFMFLAAMIYAVAAMWKRNQQLTQHVEEITERFHREIRDEMQAQIDAERAVRMEHAASIRELTSVLRSMKEVLPDEEDEGS